MFCVILFLLMKYKNESCKIALFWSVKSTCKCRLVKKMDFCECNVTVFFLTMSTVLEHRILNNIIYDFLKSFFFLLFWCMGLILFLEF